MSVCGYRTKKGTPCQRATQEGGERCYAHEGLGGTSPTKDQRRFLDIWNACRRLKQAVRLLGDSAPRKARRLKARGFEVKPLK